MKRSILSAIVLGSALAALPLCASAESNVTADQLATGAVCGHISVDPMKVVELQYQAIPSNIVVARSATEVVSTSVQPNGNFCFANLQADLHQISAFGDEPAEYNALVVPVAGKTTFIEVTRGNSW